MFFFVFVFWTPPNPRCFLLSVIGLLSLPSWLVICLAFVFQVFVLLLLLVFLFLLAVGRSVGVGRHSGRWRSILEAQRASDGWRQDHAQDDAADDDHDLLLQGDRRHTVRYRKTERAELLGSFFLTWSQNWLTLLCFTYFVSSVIYIGLQSADCSFSSRVAKLPNLLHSNRLQSSMIGCVLQQCFLGVVVVLDGPSFWMFSNEHVTLRAWLWYLTAFLVSDTARST